MDQASIGSRANRRRAGAEHTLEPRAQDSTPWRKDAAAGQNQRVTLPAGGESEAAPALSVIQRPHLNASAHFGGSDARPRIVRNSGYTRRTGALRRVEACCWPSRRAMETVNDLYEVVNLARVIQDQRLGPISTEPAARMMSGGVREATELFKAGRR